MVNALAAGCQLFYCKINENFDSVKAEKNNNNNKTSRIIVGLVATDEMWRGGVGAE